MAISLNSLSFPPAYALRRTGLAQADALFYSGQGGFFRDFSLDGADYALCTWKPIPSRGIEHYSRVMDTTRLTSVFGISAYCSLPSSISGVTSEARLNLRYDPPDPNRSAVLSETRAFMDSFHPQLDGDYIFSKRSGLVTASARGNPAAPKNDLIYLNTPIDLAFVGVSIPFTAGSRVFISTSENHYKVLAPSPAFGSNDPPAETDFIAANGYTVSASGFTIIASWISGAFISSYYLYGATNNPITLRSIGTSTPQAMSVGMFVPSYYAESFRYQDASQLGSRTYKEYTDILEDSSNLFPDLGSFWMQRGQVVKNFYGTIETYTIG